MNSSQKHSRYNYTTKEVAVHKAAHCTFHLLPPLSLSILSAILLHPSLANRDQADRALSFARKTRFSQIAGWSKYN